MEVFERGERQRIIITTLLLVLGLAAAGVGAVVFGQASQIDDAVGPAATVIRLGPLSLMEITKTPLSGSGFMVGIEMLDGMFFYAASWLVVGAVIVLIRLKLAGAVAEVP